ncbi:Protein of unknown function DUF2865 [Rhabdaerophilaceae bacterium]
MPTMPLPDTAAMTRGQSLSRLGIVLFVIQCALAIAAGLPAFAQSNAAICTQIRTELSALQRIGGSGNAAALGRLRAELVRVRNALAQNDCNSRGFLGFGGPPPICAPLQAQAAQIEARLRQSDSGNPNAGRQAQLVAAFERYNCNGDQAPQRGVIYAAPQPPGLFEQLFGGRSNAVVDDRPPPQLIDPELAEELREKARLGGRTPVCVRACDGYFFPVNFEGLTARDEHSEVCEALCPGAETQVMYMRLGADIETAATRDGRGYASFPNAGKYRESRDPACFCRPPGVTVAHLAKDQDDIVEARKGDLVVSPEQAEAMSRPKDTPAPRQTRAPRRQAADAPAEPVPVPESAIPTAGNASAGIGPRLGDTRIVGGGQGAVQDVVGADGVKRQVRVVAPAPNAPEPQGALRGATRP